MGSEKREKLEDLALEAAVELNPEEAEEVQGGSLRAFNKFSVNNAASLGGFDSFQKVHTALGDGSVKP